MSRLFGRRRFETGDRVIVLRTNRGWDDDGFEWTYMNGREGVVLGDCWWSRRYFKVLIQAPGDDRPTVRTYHYCALDHKVD